MQGTKNLTEGPIKKQLFNLALPIMGTSFIQMAYSITDMAWVGRLGSEAVAAVGAVGILTWMTSSISYLNKVGSEVSVAQSIGAQEAFAADAKEMRAVWISTVYSADYPSTTNNAETQKNEFIQKLEQAQAFNEGVLKRGTLAVMTEAEKAEYNSLLNLNGDGVMGYIEIPKLDLRLSIAHGTDEDVLQKMVGHVEGTSLPVGGESTHCVLSGHRGLPSAKLFTNLDQLAEGDLFVIRTLDEVLTYEVDRILIVLPSELQALAAEEGKDLCTLVTCTPYGVNSHRMLVRGHRVDNQSEAVRLTADAIRVDPLLVAPIAAIPLLLALFALLPIRLAAEGQTGISGLCRARFGARVGGVCGALFFLLSAVTGGAMLAACAELSALVWPIRHAYALGFTVTAVLAALLCAFETRGLAVVGGALCGLLPILLIRLLLLPPGEACFLPEGPPDAVLRAALDGTLYAALNAAMMAGALPMLLTLSARRRLACAALVVLLFGGMLTLGMLVCQRQMQSVLMQPLPFVWLSRGLGAGGYLLVALCLYAAALSTLCAMLCAMTNLLPRFLARYARLTISALLCAALALMGFGRIVQSGYPILGALCAALLVLLVLPFHQEASMSAR